jgi:hypothetical protein
LYLKAELIAREGQDDQLVPGEPVDEVVHLAVIPDREPAKGRRVDDNGHLPFAEVFHANFFSAWNGNLQMGKRTNECMQYSTIKSSLYKQRKSKSKFL